MYRCFVGLLILVLLNLPAICPAETAHSPKRDAATLPEVVVTATRSAQQVEKVPAHVTVITEQDIQNSNAKAIPDLLRAEQGIVVHEIELDKPVSRVLRALHYPVILNLLLHNTGRREPAVL